MSGGEGGFDDEGHVVLEAGGVPVFDGVPAGPSAVGVADGDGLPGPWGEIEGRAVGGCEAGAAVDGAGGGGAHGDEVAQDVGGAGAGAVPFEQGELGVVAIAALALAEAGPDLVEAFAAGGEEPLHLEFGGGAEERAAGGRAVDVLLVGGGGDAHGGFDLGEAVGVERGAEGAHDGGAARERLRGGEGGGVHGREGEGRHSWRSATIGSRREARSAG